MTIFEDFFNEDPWSGIEGPIYPSGRQLMVGDQRYWVSINEKNEYVFFIHEKGIYKVKNPQELDDLKISVEFVGDGTRLICTLTDETLKDKFATIIKEVSYLTKNYNGKKVLEKSSSRILSWADFLRPTRKGLTRSEKIGLWGELYMLTKILPESHSIDDSVRFWIGPEGKKQDFTFNNIAIEAKTTLSGDGDTIKISSIEQLDKITENLYLIHVFINLSDSLNGVSLKDMYDQILIETGEDTLLNNAFKVKISYLYGKATEDQLEEKFEFLKYDFYHVDEDFPKITPNNMSSAITKASYSINTAALLPYKIKEKLKDVII